MIEHKRGTKVNVVNKAEFLLGQCIRGCMISSVYKPALPHQLLLGLAPPSVFQAGFHGSRHRASARLLRYEVNPGCNKLCSSYDVGGFSTGFI